MSERLQGAGARAMSGSERGARSVWKGLVAGLIAGVSATAVKAVAERLHRARGHGLVGGEQPLVPRQPAGRGLDWGVGAAVGAAYGVAAEYIPAATHKDGASFGLLLMTVARERGERRHGLESAGGPDMGHDEASETANHILFGVVAERVRRVVRRALR